VTSASSFEKVRLNVDKEENPPIGGDIRKRHASVGFQHMTCPLNPDAGHARSRRLAHLLLKQPLKNEMAQAHFPGKIFQLQPGVVFFLDDIVRFLYPPVHDFSIYLKLSF